jgi:hypothetical protein
MNNNFLSRLYHKYLFTGIEKDFSWQRSAKSPGLCEKFFAACGGRILYRTRA